VGNYPHAPAVLRWKKIILFPHCYHAAEDYISYQLELLKKKGTQAKNYLKSKPASRDRERKTPWPHHELQPRHIHRHWPHKALAFAQRENDECRIMTMR
jgi:hypothetical protein